MAEKSKDVSVESTAKLKGFLKNIKLFSIFSDRDLSKIISEGRFKKFNKGTSIVVEGENSQGLYIIFSGHVSIHKTDVQDGKLIRLVNLEMGSVFGELSLLNKSPRAATVIAESTTELFELDAQNFNKFINNISIEKQLGFYRGCSLDLAERFRVQNEDYLNTQRLLWKKAFGGEKTA